MLIVGRQAIAEAIYLGSERTQAHATYTSSEVQESDDPLNVVGL